MSERDNERRWDAAARGAYEVWYLTWNHAASGQGFWLRYVTEAPIDGPPRAELWFARFDPARPERTFGFHRRFPADRLGSSIHPFELVIAGSRLGHDHAFGEIAGDGHDIRWDLRWTPAPETLRFYPDVLYTGGGRAPTTALSPNPHVVVSGRLVVDGEELSFDGDVLGQTHLWGTKHAYAWTWGRCAELPGAPDGHFELIGARLQRRGITLPPVLLFVLDLEGERHRFNQFRHLARNRVSWGGGHVAFSAWSALVKVEGELTASPRQMIEAPYVDPDGTEVFCANTEIGDARLTVWKRGALGWKEHRLLVGRRRAHFEVGGRARDPAVTREHVLVE
jgi:hypothetical protein